MGNTIRLGVEIPKELHQSLKDEAKKQGKLFSFYIIELITKAVEPRQEIKKTELLRTDHHPDDVKLALELYEMIALNTHTKRKVITNSDYDTFRKLREIDGWSYAQIQYIIRWCQKDEFWHKNILSATKLRLQFKRLVLEAKGDSQKNRVLSA